MLSSRPKYSEGFRFADRTYPVNGRRLAAAARRRFSSIQREMSAVSAPALMHSLATWEINRRVSVLVLAEVYPRDLPCSARRSTRPYTGRAFRAETRCLRTKGRSRSRLGGVRHGICSQGCPSIGDHRATPRPVRKAMHPARTVRNAAAATPRPLLQQVSRAAYTARHPAPGAAENAMIGAALYPPRPRRRHRARFGIGGVIIGLILLAVFPWWVPVPIIVAAVAIPVIASRRA